MIVTLLRATRVPGGLLYDVSMAPIGLCIGLWIRAKTVDQEERGNAERRALFVGLWPPMFWLIGRRLEQDQAGSRHAGGAWLARSR